MRKYILVAVAILCVVGTSHALELGFDNFDYPDGPLVGNGVWANHSGGPDDLLVAGGQVVVELTGTPSEDANFVFTPPPAMTDDVYFGFDFSVGDLGTPYVGTDNEYFIHFKDSGFNFAARVDIVAAGAMGDFSVGLSSDGSTADVTWGTDLTYGVTYRAVVRYSQTNNQAQLWIDASTAGDTSILGADQPDPGDTVESIGLRQSGSSMDETVFVDGLVIGTEFADVVNSVPVELQSFSIE